MRTLVNVVQFQIGWFACVLGAASGRAWTGAMIALALVAFHFARAENLPAELALVVVAAAFGVVADTALIQLGWLTLSSGVSFSGVTAYWMVALWMIFATTLYHSLGWLRRQVALSAVLGAAAGPLSYYAGERLGALEIADSAAAYLGIAIVWAAAMPALLWSSTRLEAARWASVSRRA
jgi:Protein of unknown function (DUF2878)